MEMPPEFFIEVIFERHGEGHYYIHSPQVRGLHLAGPKLERLDKLLESAIKDLFWHNEEVIVDRIRWVPRLGESSKGPTESGASPPVETRAYVVNVQHAA